MTVQTLSKLAVVVLVLFSASAVNAQDAKTSPAPTPTPKQITVTDVWLQGTRVSAPSPTATPTPSPTGSPSASPSPIPTGDFMRTDAGLRDQILVEVDNLAEVSKRDNFNARDLVLYLNGQEVKGAKAVAVEGPNQNWVAFELKRTSESDPVWRSLLGSPRSDYRNVGVSVGFANQQAIPTTPGKLQPTLALRLYYPRWFFISLAVLILLVILFVRRARKGAFIHDSDPPKPPEGKLKPYSLALTQAAWWFFLVIASFVFIYVITGDYNTMTDQALILMGIGTGTALGAFMINASKRDTADSQLGTLRPAMAKLDTEIDELTAKGDRLKQEIAQNGAAASPDQQAALRDNEVALAEKQAKLAEIQHQIADAESGLTKPVSVGFFNDILTDVNGITLHRFQMVVWTIVLGIVFVLGVYRELAMPAFSVTLLALMGISAGTYLGFKIPERQTDPTDPNQQQGP